MTATTREACEVLDRTDPLASLRQEFVLEPDVIYLDGNSLGALPRAVPARVADVLRREWGQGKLLVAALRLRPGRDVVLSERGNFPTDLYIT